MINLYVGLACSVRVEGAWKFRNLFVFPGRSFGRDNVTLYLTLRREEVKSYIAALAYTAIYWLHSTGVT